MASLYREYDPAVLARLQEILRAMLRDFSSVCEKHGIAWWTDAGTTIGALRHGGMIPWDDDIDLCMRRADFERFLAVAEEEMSDRYYVLDAFRFPAYPLPTARLCLRGTKFREESMRGVDAPFGIFLDLYAFDNLADDPRRARRQWKRAWLWGKARILRAVRSPVLYFSGPRAWLARAVCFAGHYVARALFSDAFLRDAAMRSARSCEGEKTARVFFPFAPVPFRNDIRVDELFPTQEVPFDGQVVRVARCADAFLRKEFGDYMVPPPPEKRHNHPPVELDFGPWTAEGGSLRRAAASAPSPAPGSGESPREPVFSIAVLTWNRSVFLEKCLESVFAARSPDIESEVVVLNNGSTDDTARVLGKFSSERGFRVLENGRNEGIHGYRRLFAAARGKYVIELDDDVLSLPAGFDRIFLDYFASYPDYGYIGLAAAENPKTNAGCRFNHPTKPDRRGRLRLDEGPVGGWCASFRRRDYALLDLAFRLMPFVRMSMKHGEDGAICRFEKLVMRRRIGTIRTAECLHAYGPLWAAEAGLLRREIEKYRLGGCPELAAEYERRLAETDAGASRPENG